MPNEKESLIPAKPTTQVFFSLVTGQVLNFIAISLFSAWLGLDKFGKYGICLLDYTIFCNLANFSLPAASIPFAIKGRFRDRVYSLAMGTRWWTSLAALSLYLLFEISFRDKEMVIVALALAPTVLLNPAQFEWWFVAQKSWRELIVHRFLGGTATLSAAFLLVRQWPTLFTAATSFTIGTSAASIYLLVRSAKNKKGLRLPWPRLGNSKMGWLWYKSLPLALAGGLEFLFIPLGLYAFKAQHSMGSFLGAYLASYRLILAASLFASSLFLVLLPTFSSPHKNFNQPLVRLFDKMALLLILPWLFVPLLSKLTLSLLFPKTGWDEHTLQFGAWCFATMALATYLHLLRMPPLTRALAEGKSWMYFRRYLAAGLVNLTSIGIGIYLQHPKWLPGFSLAGELVFTAGWVLTLKTEDKLGRWGRVAALILGSGFYLAWVSYIL